MTTLKIEIPTYDPSKGIEYKWEDDFAIETKIINGQILIAANRAGLVSLANHLLNLAQEIVPSGGHLHLDEYNSLEAGSLEMVIEKK